MAGSVARSFRAGVVATLTMLPIAAAAASPAHKSLAGLTIPNRLLQGTESVERL